VTVRKLCWLPCYLRYTHTASNKMMGLGISNAERFSLTVLDLRGMGLTSLPFAIRNAVSLRHIDLSYNAFLSVPSALFMLPALVTLALDGNAISFLFSDGLVFSCTLECLKLAYNRLTSLPDEITTISGSLKQLISTER